MIFRRRQQQRQQPVPRDVVLVVDDNPDFRDLLVSIVRNRGFVAVPARDCPEAIALLGRFAARVRLVLLDYWMPSMPPTECVAALQQAAAPADIVLMTAAVSAGERAEELHLARWLAKPFSLRELESILEETAGGTAERPALR